MNRSNVMYAYLLSLLTACGFGSIALAVKGDQLVAFDHCISSFIQSWENPMASCMSGSMRMTK
ncbi:hypothetical protein NLX71_23745 [Paenibacillus sp. MZ04-78.2]|uniref:hypothetical protein n=1 Tax=Paenibacillus sp. MZ04-78.2 TaxID=2962034 RepID=UPI0020B7B497|nr:hypothetical protein [Paenibacillus sp. MZ04-78.2]MCP3776274.1 hypothetical protein [Paenibacillus sp. MZ04-78.2]